MVGYKDALAAKGAPWRHAHAEELMVSEQVRGTREPDFGDAIA